MAISALSSSSAARDTTFECAFKFSLRVSSEEKSLPKNTAALSTPFRRKILVILQSGAGPSMPSGYHIVKGNVNICVCRSSIRSKIANVSSFTSFNPPFIEGLLVLARLAFGRH